MRGFPGSDPASDGDFHMKNAKKDTDTKVSSVLPANVLAPIKLNTSKKIETFSVSTDSVVATARLVTSGPVRLIRIDWGDGVIDRIRVLPGQSEVPLAGTNPLPKGVYEFQHVYELSSDGRGFWHEIWVRTDDADGGPDVRRTNPPVVVTPRWRIKHYDLSVRLADTSPPQESDKPTQVTLWVDGQDVRGWQWRPDEDSGPGGFTRLGLSMVQFEVEAPAIDGMFESLTAVFDFVRGDPVNPENVSRITTVLTWAHNFLDGDFGVKVTGSSAGGLPIAYKYFREVELLVPLKPVNPGTFAPA